MSSDSCLLLSKSHMSIYNILFLGGEASEDAAQEDFQYKLKGFIDSTVDKR